MKRKAFYTIVMVCFLTLAGGLPAFAWQVSLLNVDGDLVQGESYAMTVVFEGETTDALDFLSFAIQWDTDLLELSSFVDVASYDRSPGFPDPDYTLWGPTFASPTLDIENGRYSDVNAESNLEHMGEFFPEATGETLMATFTFTARQTGSFTDMAGFYFTPEGDLNELVTINGRTLSSELGELEISKIGSASVMSSPVPVPAAAWLLGSGLLGILGLRRKNS